MNLKPKTSILKLEFWNSCVFCGIYLDFYFYGTIYTFKKCYLLQNKQNMNE